MALEIDRDCHELHNDAIDIKHHDGIEEEDVSGSVPQSWAKFSKNNVEESQCEYSAYLLLYTWASAIKQGFYIISFSFYRVPCSLSYISVKSLFNSPYN